MSVHSVPASDSPVEGVAGLLADVGQAIRQPSEVRYLGATVEYVFTPDLTAAEVTTFGELLRARQSRILARAERNALEPDIATLRTYQGIASPTLAQTAAATKAQSRILRAILRDG